MAGAVQAKTLSEEEFAARFLEALKAAQPDAVIRADGTMNLTIKPANRGEVHLYLGNAYKNYIDEPGRLEEIVNSYAGQMKTMMAVQSKKHVVDRTRVVATIKDRSWIDEMRRAVEERTGKDNLEIVYEEFCDGLVVIYGEDTSDSMMYLTQKHLEETGLQRSGLRELAVANLRRIVPNYKMEHIAGVWSILSSRNIGRGFHDSTIRQARATSPSKSQRPTRAPENARRQGSVREGRRFGSRGSNPKRVYRDARLLTNAATGWTALSSRVRRMSPSAGGADRRRIPSRRARRPLSALASPLSLTSGGAR